MRWSAFSNATALYDVIYQDTFLKPSEATDETGIPLDLTSAEFYRKMQDKLTDGGAAVFNLHLETGLKQALAPIREAFASVHLFVDPRFKNEFSVAEFIDDLR